MQIAEGQVLTDGEAQYRGTIADPAVLDGKILTPAPVFTVTVVDTVNGSVFATPRQAYATDTVTLTVTPDEGCVLTALSYTPDGGEPVEIFPTDGVYSFIMPEANVTVTAVFKRSVQIPEPVPGLVYNGESLTGVPAGIGYTLSGVTAAIDAGSYAATASLQEGYIWSDGTSADIEIEWSIAPKQVTLTVDKKSKTYGGTDPELTATVEGTVGSDTLNYSLSRTAGEDVGEYAITVTLGENPNYDVTAVDGKLTINKADPSCTIPEGLVAIVGWTLSKVELPAGWSWADPMQQIEEAGEIPFKATFTPEDTQNYNVLENIDLIVNAKLIRFIDVPEGSYFYDPVYWAVARGITTGTSETTFSPHMGATRAQVVTFLWRMAGCPEPETTVCRFRDVPENAYYYKCVIWAVENGITFGTSATTFSPDKVCTREQSVTFLWRLAGSPEPETSECFFNDVAPKGFAYKPILWASENGITKGTSRTTFSPKDTCTHAQIVTFLYRYHEVIE